MGVLVLRLACFLAGTCESASGVVACCWRACETASGMAALFWRACETGSGMALRNWRGCETASGMPAHSWMDAKGVANGSDGEICSGGGQLSLRAARAGLRVGQSVGKFPGIGHAPGFLIDIRKPGSKS